MAQLNMPFDFVPSPNLEQYFLRDLDKIEAMIECLSLEPGQTVVEVGAGIGSVAVHVPEQNPMILVELDEALCKNLNFQFRQRPQTQVLQADALSYLAGLREPVKLISNLPFFLTDEVLNLIAQSPIQVAVVTVREDFDTTAWKNRFAISDITTLESEDFSPNQPFNSRVIKCSKRKPAANKRKSPGFRRTPGTICGDGGI